MKSITATINVSGCKIPFVARDTSDPITFLTDLGFVTIPVWVYSPYGKHWYKINELKKSERESLLKLPIITKEIQKQAKVEYEND